MKLSAEKIPIDLLKRKWIIHDSGPQCGIMYFKLYCEDDADDDPFSILMVEFTETVAREPRPYQDGIVFEEYIDRNFDSATFSHRGRTWELSEDEVKQMINEWDRD